MLMIVGLQVFQKLLRLNLNRNINTRRQIQLLQFIYRLRGRLDNIEQTFVRADFKLIHRFFVDMRGAIHRELLDQSRQRNRSGYARARALGSLDDVDGGLIKHAMIERLQSNPDALAITHLVSF